MTHDVYGYRNGKPFAALTRRVGAGMIYQPLDKPERHPPENSDGAMLWRTTEQMRTALELLDAGESHAEQRRFIVELLEASREEGGVWVRFS